MMVGNLIGKSRSRKKHAIVKDKNGRYYNRITRRVISYNVCDYVINYDNLKGYWKRMMSKSNTEISDAVNKAKRK